MEQLNNSLRKKTVMRLFVAGMPIPKGKDSLEDKLKKQMLKSLLEEDCEKGEWQS